MILVSILCNLTLALMIIIVNSGCTAVPYNKTSSTQKNAQFKQNGKSINQIILLNQTSKNCKNPLDSWRSKYKVRDDILPDGLYQQIYANWRVSARRRLSINKDGTICKCSFNFGKFVKFTQKNNGRFEKKSGRLEGNNTLKWKKKWSDPNDFPNSSDEDYIVTLWDQGKLRAPLLIQHHKKTGCLIVSELIRDNSMSEEEICDCDESNLK